MAESELRRSLIISHGSWGIFATRPITATLLGLTVAVLVYPLRCWASFAAAGRDARPRRPRDATTNREEKRMRMRGARTRRPLSCLALGVTAVPWPASAQPGVFPTRPITFVVGFAPGGGADVFARALADAARTTLPQALAVENRAGAGGTAAAAYAAGRPADGHTHPLRPCRLRHHHADHHEPAATQVGRLRAGGANPRRGGMALRPSGLPVEDDRPGGGARQGAAEAGAGSPAPRSAGSTASSSSRGRRPRTSTSSTSPTRAAGRPPWPSSERTPSCSSGTSPSVSQHVEAKKMVPLAVASEKRSAIFPNVPTLKEKGWDVVMVQWRSVLAPKGTPRRRVALLAEAFQKAMATDSWKTFNESTKAIDAVPGSRRLPHIPRRRGSSLREDHRPAGPPEEVGPRHAGLPDRLRRVVRPGRALLPAGAAAVRGLARVLLPEPGQLPPDLRPGADPPRPVAGRALGGPLRAPLGLLRQHRRDHAHGEEGRARPTCGSTSTSPSRWAASTWSSTAASTSARTWTRFGRRSTRRWRAAWSTASGGGYRSSSRT